MASSGLEEQDQGLSEGHLTVENWWWMMAGWERAPVGVSLVAWYRGLVVMEKLGIQGQKNPSRPKNERI